LPLDVLVGGAADGPALLAHHGTPSEAASWSEWHEDVAARGFRLISITRPGYAASARRPGRSVADASADARAVLDRLDVPWFVTVGWSGGGPHALAAAALQPDRCRAAATLAGVAPYGQPDLDFLAGMGPENVDEFGTASLGEAALRAWLEVNLAPLRTVTGAGIIDAFGGLLPQADKDVLADGFADVMAASCRRALAPGIDGQLDDDLAFIRDWGFALDAVRVPVAVWQGDLDLMVPAAHGAWLAAHLPHARHVFAPGHGHLSLVKTNRAAILDTLLADALTHPQA
jgi:pimeloyl-ACP methyl ester carboxylesterase